MPTLPTDCSQRFPVQQGFTLLELMVALVVASLLAAVAMPSAQRMNETMRYREAVRDLLTATRTARRDAFATGSAHDLLIFEDEPSWALVPADRASDFIDGDIEARPLPDELSFDVTYAAEVSPGRGVASIRFYPSGGASGGDIDIVRPTGSGVRLKIDWLLGEVVQVPVSAR